MQKWHSYTVTQDGRKITFKCIHCHAEFTYLVKDVNIGVYFTLNNHEKDNHHETRYHPTI